MRTLSIILALLVSLAASSQAQAQYFGKNKVQYKDFKWRVLETPHFDIYFYEREAEIVQDAARRAELAYARLSTTLNHEFKRKIPLILYASHSDFQQTNITPSMIDIGTGGITELARRRVFLPFTGSMAEFEHVLTHELVHAFEIDILFDPEAGDPLHPFALSPPLWLMEGLAEFLSRGPNDPHTEMWLRDAALSGYLLSLEQLELVRDIRVYRFGQSILEYFARQYGSDKLGDLLRAIREHEGLENALPVVANITLADFSENWKTAIRRRHLPQLAEHQTTREFARILVARGSEDASMLLVPSISPDGEHLAYVSDAGLTRDLCMRDLERDGSTRRLVQGDMKGDFESLRFFSAASSWAPDSRTLAFAAKASGEDALYLMDTEETRITERLTFGFDEVQTPSFSPDGQEIVFVGLSHGESNLYRVRRDGSNLKQLSTGRWAVRDPQWSPDGRRVVFVTDANPNDDPTAADFGRFRLILLELDSGALRDITPFSHGKSVSPAWSGDGEYIAFVSDQDGISNIYLLHLPTGQVFRLTDSVTGVSGILPTSPSLSWARESNRLVFSAFSAAGWDLYAIDDPQQRIRPVEIEPGEIEPQRSLVAAALDESEDGKSSQGFALERSDNTLLTWQAGSTPPPEPPTIAVGSQSGANVLPDAAPVEQHVSGDSLFAEREYKVRLKPDLSNLGGVGGYDTGIGGQSQLHFSDLLGNHTLSLGFGIYGSLKDSDLSVSYLDRSKRTNYMLSAFQFKRRFGFLGGSRVESEEQTYRGLRVAVLRPFSKFSRLEASFQLAGVGGRHFLGQTAAQAAQDREIDRVRTFAGPGIAYIVDTAMFGSTGPIMGRRIRLSLEGGLGQVDFATFEADMRQYWNVRRSYAFAARFFVGSSVGSTPQTFYMGGSYTLRGYDYGALLGNHAALFSAEFRFPLLRHLALGWPLPLELSNIRGVLFVDAASAWDGEFLRTSRAVADETTNRGPQVSFGFGTRVNLGAFVLKLDWAQRYDSDSGNLSRGSSVSLGADF